MRKSITKMQKMAVKKAAKNLLLDIYNSGSMLYLSAAGGTQNVFCGRLSTGTGVPFEKVCKWAPDIYKWAGTYMPFDIAGIEDCHLCDNIYPL